VSDEHIVSAMTEKWADNTRYRGRCSCGTQTHVTYTKAAMALESHQRQANREQWGQQIKETTHTKREGDR
jgi:predicted NBD/HSP70 family sugar kinase